MIRSNIYYIGSNFTNSVSIQLGSHGLKILLLVLYNYPVGPICPNLAELYKRYNQNAFE